jgi:hypothetical protein
MTDTESEGGSWRREMLARPLTVSQLREVISELEHCLAVERRRTRELTAEISRISGAGSPSAAALDHSPPS